MTLRPPWPYRALLAAAPALAAGLGPFSLPVRVARRGRSESARRFREWGRTGRRQAPVILWHAPSAGEWRQAEPVLRRLRRQHPAWQWALTYTSPSAAAVADSFGADVHGFLPWDRAADIAGFLAALDPALVVCTRLDLWPELAWQVSARRTPLALIAATVRPGSGRLRWPAHAVLRRAYACVTRAAAVTPDDAGRLARLGVAPAAIEVLGDPRADAVLERVAGAMREPAAAPLLVAGSTWPADERVLLQAFAAVRQECPAARLLIAPHVPAADTRARLDRLASALQLPHAAPWQPRDQGEPIRVLESVGGLALIYGEGRIAYVGGGFGTAGLHSVLEPAAWGVPVIVGPHWQESRDARQLRDAGALITLGTEPVAELARQWAQWIADEAARARAGAAARQVVEREQGAADRTAALLAGLLATERGQA